VLPYIYEVVCEHAGIGCSDCSKGIHHSHGHGARLSEPTKDSESGGMNCVQMGILRPLT